MDATNLSLSLASSLSFLPLQRTQYRDMERTWGCQLAEAAVLGEDCARVLCRASGTWRNRGQEAGPELCNFGGRETWQEVSFIIRLSCRLDSSVHRLSLSPFSLYPRFLDLGLPSLFSYSLSVCRGFTSSSLLWTLWIQYLSILDNLLSTPIHPYR